MSLADYIEQKPVLETSNLILRTLTPDDIEDLREWTPNKALYQYWGKNPGKADKDPALLFAKPAKPTKSFHLGIEHKTDHKVIGDLWVYLIESNRMAKVAIRLSDKYQHKGYAKEALKKMVSFCFEETELKRLWTDVDVRNTPSWKLLEACGFLREGKIRQGKAVSTWCDYYIYGLLKEDYCATVYNE